MVTYRVTNHPPSSLETTLYCSIQAASLGPRAFFFRGIVYSTSRFLSPPIDAHYTVSMDYIKSHSLRQLHHDSSSHWSHLLAKQICHARSSAACTGKLCRQLPSDWATPRVAYLIAISSQLMQCLPVYSNRLTQQFLASHSNLGCCSSLQRQTLA